MTFYELEKECKKRKIKFIINIFLSVVVLSLISFGIYYFLNKYLKSKQTKKTQSIVVKKIVEKKVLQPIEEIESNSPPTLSFALEVNTPKIRKEPSKQLQKQHTQKTDKDIKPVKQKLLNISNLPSYETCIKLANKAYLMKDYQKALKWAKNANLQNRSLPESWILTAKSLYRLNQKTQAIQILEIYYRYTKNKQILNLINAMEKGIL